MNEKFAGILTIGDELLIGQITDTNSAWIGQQLDDIGWKIRSILTVGDEVTAIVDALERMMVHHEVVVITGGLGPTSDDNTVEAMAVFFDKPLVLFEEEQARVRQIYESKGKKWMDQHRKMFFLPMGVEVLSNETGTAPGMYMIGNGVHFFFTPGVPVELRFLFDHHIRHRLMKWNSATRVQTRIFTAGLGETTIVERLEESFQKWASDLSVAFLPYLGGVRLRLTAVGPDRRDNETLIEHARMEIQQKLGRHFITTKYDRWNQIIQEVMIRENLTLSTAESCTGGFIASQITDLPGSSGYFVGSVVAYANTVKQNVLKVKTKTLEAYGAVSSQCAEEMVDGILTLLNTDVGIAVTGIAGPGGGTAEKPVGTVFVSVGNRRTKETIRLNYRSTRDGIVEYTYHQSMYLLFKFLST